MCLAIPGRVLDVRGETAHVDFQGNRLEINILFTPDVTKGDWILVHAGFAISQLDEADARETWKYLVEADLVEPADAPFDG